MISQIALAVGVMAVGVCACAGYFWLSNKLLDLIFPERNRDVKAASRNLARRAMIRP